MDAPDLLFYDGACGLCHATVRFACARDTDGSRFCFAPIGGAAWRRRWSDAAAAPERTVVLHSPGGEVFTRSAAVLRVLARLGGGWARLARVLAWVPRPLRDAGYRLVSWVRRRLWRAPSGACPVSAAHVPERFDLAP